MRADEKRLSDALAKASPEKLKAMKALIVNAAFMERKLTEMRKIVQGQPPVMTMEGSTGQIVVKPNPCYTTYSTLYRDYASAIKQICAEIPAEDKRSSEVAKTKLAELRVLNGNRKLGASG